MTHERSVPIWAFKPPKTGLPGVRQAILRKRLAHLKKASSNKEVLGYELDTIFDLIQLIRESSLTLADPDNLSRQIDGILIEVESAEEAMEEVSGMDYEGTTDYGEEADEFAAFDAQLQGHAEAEEEPVPEPVEYRQ